MLHRQFLFGRQELVPVPVPPPYLYSQDTQLQSTRTSTIYDYYGRCVALNTDGSVLVVGSDETSNASPSNSTAGPGRVYVYQPNNTLVATLVASDGVVNDSFGKSVAVSGDGNTIVVGAPGCKIGSNTRQGAAYVFQWSPANGTWLQTDKLIASDGTSEDTFGYNVSISADGTTIAVGSNADDIIPTYRVGAVYVYSKITTTTGTANISGDVLTVTATSGPGLIGVGNLVTGAGLFPGTNITALITGAGGVGTYRISTGVPSSLTGVAITVTTSWQTPYKLYALDAKPDDNYGCSTALSTNGDVIVIGASGADSNGVANCGAVYSYVRRLIGTSFSYGSDDLTVPQRKIVANVPVTGAGYGFSVALSTNGTGLVVGAPLSSVGSMYVLDRAATLQWRERKKIVSADGVIGDRFGWSVDIGSSTRWIMSGAPLHDVGLLRECGAAYIYVNDGLGWQQTAKLIAGDAASGDNFGYSVSLTPDAQTAAVGAPLRSVDTLPPPSTTYIHGSTYIYTQ